MIRFEPGRVYVDTNVFCDAFEGTSAVADGLREMFILARNRPKRIVTSELTLAELLGRETGVGWTKQSRFYLDLIIGNDFIDLRAVTRDILLESGNFRRAAQTLGRKVHLADAIHGVTAIDAQCGHLLTSDRRFFLADGPQLLIPDRDGIFSAKQVLDA